MNYEKHDIQKWLIDGEHIIYDIGSYGLTYEKSGGCRGVITNKRTFFYKENEKNDISHNLITSISHKTIKIKDTKFLGSAIACFGIGVFFMLFAYGGFASDTTVESYFYERDFNDYHFYLIIGIILIAIGVFLLSKRKAMITQLLEISTASGRTYVNGDKDVLREMMIEIRNNTFDKK